MSLSILDLSLSILELSLSILELSFLELSRKDSSLLELSSLDSSRKCVPRDSGPKPIVKRCALKQIVDNGRSLDG